MIASSTPCCAELWGWVISMDKDTDTPTGWCFWIDRGGTFTDVVALSPQGEVVTRKLLSAHPERYKDAAIQGIRDLLGVGPGEPLPADRVASVKMGTTVATNALLERRGEAVALVVTEGFRDLLRIGYQNRPRIFDRHIVLPDRLEERVIEARERLDAEGRSEIKQRTRELETKLNGLITDFESQLRDTVKELRTKEFLFA